MCLFLNFWKCQKLVPTPIKCQMNYLQNSTISQHVDQFFVVHIFGWRNGSEVFITIQEMFMDLLELQICE